MHNARQFPCALNLIANKIVRKNPKEKKIVKNLYFFWRRMSVRTAFPRGTAVHTKILFLGRSKLLS